MSTSGPTTLQPHDLEGDVGARASVSQWMSDRIDGFDGIKDVTRFVGGQSNPTYRIDSGNSSYVLRQKPVGPILKGAHAIEREARVQAALEQTGFPVATIHGLCEDELLIGAPFYVMDMIQGRIFWDARLLELPAPQRKNYYDELVSVLARLHNVDFENLGLSDYGRQGGYIARQLKRWIGQYKSDEAAGRLEDLDRLAEWLPANIPDHDETALIHGDYRLDNVIFHPTECRIVAVLDWELSTIGHPLADFAYHLMMYRLPPSLVAGLSGVNLEHHSLPSEDEYVSHYKAMTGRSQLPDLDYHLAFNLFRFAAIVHGIKGRTLRGNAASEEAGKLIEFLPKIAQIARQQAGI